MPKLTEKLKKKIANGLRPVVDEVGKQLYNQLDVVINKMNIDYKTLFDSTSDYNSFWELVAKYYYDYVNLEEYEYASC